MKRLREILALISYNWRPLEAVVGKLFSGVFVLRWLASTGTECRRSCDHARRAFSFTGAIFFKRIKT